jgi:predicted RNA-binding protein with PUA-like domain
MACWLFKTEPDEFSIDQLAASPGGIARWDGIRNYQARNYLRDQVRQGDSVLIYHSGCRIPGVAGTASVCSNPYPDPAQFVPDSRYFDGKATPEAPRWYAVDVVFEEKFSPLLPARELRKLSELANMVLFRQGRLSVQPITEHEWGSIKNLAGANTMATPKPQKR